MTSQEKEEKDKFICQHPDIKICWHEPVLDREGLSCGYGTIRCSCGTGFTKNQFGIHIKKRNPEFTSEAGRVQLLKLVVNGTEMLFDVEQGQIIDWILDDTGLFRDFVFKELGGEG